MEEYKGSFRIDRQIEKKIKCTLIFVIDDCGFVMCLRVLVLKHIEESLKDTALSRIPEPGSLEKTDSVWLIQSDLAVART